MHYWLKPDTNILCYPVITFLSVCVTEICACIYAKTWIFKTILFVAGTKCLLTKKQIKCMRSSHTTQFHVTGKNRLQCAHNHVGHQCDIVHRRKGMSLCIHKIVFICQYFSNPSHYKLGDWLSFREFVTDRNMRRRSAFLAMFSSLFRCYAALSILWMPVCYSPMLMSVF